MGLCQDLGLLIRLRENSSMAGVLGDALTQPSDSRLGLELVTGDGHDKIGHSLFTEWSFPEELTLPVLFHHQPEEAPQPQRISARVAHAAEALADLPEEGARIAFHTDTDRRFSSLESRTTSICLAVGPEGGFSPAELELLERTRFTIVGLGTRTLRAETAALVACSLAQLRWGDFA